MTLSTRMSTHRPYYASLLGGFGRVLAVGLETLMQETGIDSCPGVENPDQHLASDATAALTTSVARAHPEPSCCHHRRGLTTHFGVPTTRMDLQRWDLRLGSKDP